MKEVNKLIFWIFLVSVITLVVSYFLIESSNCGNKVIVGDDMFGLNKAKSNWCSILTYLKNISTGSLFMGALIYIVNYYFSDDY